jgi:hypothetical protein
MNAASGSVDDIRNAHHAFRVIWADISEEWRDDAMRYFDSEHVQAILQGTPLIADALHELLDSFEQARREVA